ncbi:rhamnogalacturonan lyase B N-terminal domain-containing protein [Vibrio nitrifigilis]|uniref:rhamnogalacturonan endolyase n=1 Tax=Vibrio nitrifigilis TaxID=2789781 RepID=A0ABS0GKS4_9VIBR|nr:rhamnogalacturonan lyase B N-terminal domain-containing protein [Vibrio nitrifigilis]MBF9003037.1 hypothetical protein [Vibrio nitrifigilis]
MIQTKLKHTRLTTIMAIALSSSAFTAHALTLTEGDDYYKVDTGNKLVYYVSTDDCDITSLKYDSTERQKSSGSRRSQINSGLWDVTVTGEINDTNTVSKITCEMDGLTHYLISKDGEDNIYMATYITEEPSVGELRWITRLQESSFDSLQSPSNNADTTSTVESSDVFGHSDGTTSSKYYGNDRAMDLSVKGETGSDIGVFMYYGNRESSSGGPFYRDIQFQSAEVYNYMNSGHAQTEDRRVNVLYGPYALMFNDGSETPDAPDTSFIADLDLKGYVANEDRGYVSGTAADFSTDFPVVVGWSNDTAQYWTTADSDSGEYTSPAMKPGTYTETLYRGELAVGTTEVTVTAGDTTSDVEVDDTFTDNDSVVFRIGEFDGTPKGFRNYDNLTDMHPSDTRMDDWEQTNFVAGDSADSDFPAYQWRGVNNGIIIHYTIESGHLKTRHLRIGITASYHGARQQLVVNDDWTSSYPTATTQPTGRIMTIGTWRGNNKQFVYTIPESAQQVGDNTIELDLVSGQSGDDWLSPGVSYDAIELY